MRVATDRSFNLSWFEPCARADCLGEVQVAAGALPLKTVYDLPAIDISIPDATRLRLTGTCSPEHSQAASPQELQKDARRIGGIEIFAETGTWENLQELRWVLKDIAGVEPARKTIDFGGKADQRRCLECHPGSTECSPRACSRHP